jgi:hypothetical protein
MEDCHMGEAVTRIFLPVIKKQLPEIVDIALPWAGVFHNLVIVSIRKRYPGHARKVMNAIWGLGQMMFSKVIVVVDDDVDVHDPQEVVWKVLNHIDPERDVQFTLGPVDSLDHARAFPTSAPRWGSTRLARGRARASTALARRDQHVRRSAGSRRETLEGVRPAMKRLDRDPRSSRPPLAAGVLGACGLPRARSARARARRTSSRRSPRARLRRTPPPSTPSRKGSSTTPRTGSASPCRGFELRATSTADEIVLVVPQCDDCVLRILVSPGNTDSLDTTARALKKQAASEPTAQIVDEAADPRGARAGLHAGQGGTGGRGRAAKGAEGQARAGSAHLSRATSRSITARTSIYFVLREPSGRFKDDEDAFERLLAKLRSIRGDAPAPPPAYRPRV